MEIASESTVNNDTGEKRNRYAELGVTEYWRFDPTGECLEPPLQCDLLEDGRYRTVDLPPDPEGNIRGHSQLLGLDIYAVPGETRLHLYNPVKESWLRNLPEAEAALRDEESAHTDTRAELLLARPSVTTSGPSATPPKPKTPPPRSVYGNLRNGWAISKARNSSPKGLRYWKIRVSLPNESRHRPCLCLFGG